MHQDLCIFRIRQLFERPCIPDVAAEVGLQLEKAGLADRIRPGQTVAMTAGSRGIAQGDVILKAAVAFLRQLGAEPFLVPAMGSHGGGTADGQRQLLATHGITADACGCPVRASMDTVVLCQAPDGFPIHLDREAAEADHVLVCNRVRPHTGLRGRFQSGLLKMLLIGLGKQAGATVLHRAISDLGFDRIVRSVAAEVLVRARVVCGLAIVENAYDETALIQAVPPAEFLAREPELLQTAKRWLPRLPFPTADLLLVDQIGKEISGTGLDTNVVGRKYHDHAAAKHEYPKIKRIAVRGLSPATRGNATGIGIAEFCLSRVVPQIDVAATAINCLTSGHVSAGMIPLHYATDRQLLAAALQTIGLVEPPDARLLWIRNTRQLVELECSTAFLDEVRAREDLEIVIPPRPLPLDEQGCLPDFSALNP